MATHHSLESCGCCSACRDACPLDENSGSNPATGTLTLTSPDCACLDGAYALALDGGGVSYSNGAVSPCVGGVPACPDTGGGSRGEGVAAAVFCDTVAGKQCLRLTLCIAGSPGGQVVLTTSFSTMSVSGTHVSASGSMTFTVHEPFPYTGLCSPIATGTPFTIFFSFNN